MKGRSHTHGRGIERIATSVNTSDQACAKYIVVVLVQVLGAAPKLAHFPEMGRHCSKLAAKNARVHMTFRPIMAHDTTENVLCIKILV